MSTKFKKVLNFLKKYYVGKALPPNLFFANLQSKLNKNKFYSSTHSIILKFDFNHK